LKVEDTSQRQPSGREKGQGVSSVPPGTSKEFAIKRLIMPIKEAHPRSGKPSKRV